ncbi:alanyl-tRNA editing protein [Stomatobaculum longum]|uniref:alanyl-tRNA editing protein n=1 Tax=Stomatobaculum longum TaxID=796942 RepID=UPI0028E961A4|nr:alanyl-tRNA editing protein [Stomatobaculum longum]
MTEAIFDRDPRELCFAAEVLSSAERTADGETCFAVILDRTAFFPEQGGQKADRGTLGGAKVLDVTIRDGVITHLVDAPLSVGSTVTGTVDWARRFDFMQQHTGEHMLSGLAHRLFGAENVGFHLSEREVQVDLSVPLGAANLAELERAVNEAVFRDIPVRAFYPDAAELAAISYRQKKELTGAIRLVEIGDVDTCACCAPHVARSSEVGLLKILSAMNYKGGTRLYLACGMRAFTAFAACLDEAKEISARLSAPLGELDRAVAKVQEKSAAAESRAASIAVELILAKAETAAQRGEQAPCLVLPPLPESALQRALKPLRERFHSVIGLFSGAEETGYAFLLSGDGVDWKPFLAELRAHGGKGGGGKDRIQGRIFCKATEIPALFHDFVKNEK